MKYLTVILLTFNAFFGFNELIASEHEEFITYSWNRNEEELYLYINLADGLEFDENYTTMKTKNYRGQGCEVIFKPITAGTIFTPEGHELEEIKFTVVLNNLNNRSQVQSTIITKIFFKKINELGLSTSEVTVSREVSLLDNASIDLAEEPELFAVDDDRFDEGVITFINSFPYSEM